MKSKECEAIASRWASLERGNQSISGPSCKSGGTQDSTDKNCMYPAQKHIVVQAVVWQWFFSSSGQPGRAGCLSVVRGGRGGRRRNVPILAWSSISVPCIGLPREWEGGDTTSIEQWGRSLSWTSLTQSVCGGRVPGALWPVGVAWTLYSSLKTGSTS